MALPDNLTRIWIRGRFLDDSGNPLTRPLTVVATAQPVLVDAEADVILQARTVTAVPDPTTGVAQVQRIATDEPDVNPTDFNYRIIEPTGRIYYIKLPLSTPVIDDPTDPLDGEQVLSLATVQAAPGKTTGTVQVIYLPGEEGPQGPPGGASVTLVAGEALSGHRMVTKAPDDTAVYADNLTVGAEPLWLTLGAALSGADVDAQSSGVVDEPSWTWTPGPLYLGSNGLLTQTLPGAPAFLCQVGYATSPTSIVLDRQPSIQLAA